MAYDSSLCFLVLPFRRTYFNEIILIIKMALVVQPHTHTHLVNIKNALITILYEIILGFVVMLIINKWYQFKYIEVENIKLIIKKG